MLTRKEILEIEKTLTKFQNGDIYSPVEKHGYGEYHSIAVRLESLRIAMLRLKDETADVSKRTNKTIASVAHDMKTPLAIISGYAECLSDGMNDKDYASLIIQKTEQMNEMVIEMVESSNAEIKKQSEHKVLYGTRNLFGKIIERLRPLAQAKNIKFKVGKIPDVQVRVDEAQMERVVQNLVSNAVKYSPEKTTIKITTKTIGANFVLIVKDQGIGISKESLPYVFEQFFTEDKARSNGNSQGVGLYVVSEIMKAYSGTVWVKSKKGKGSTFAVSLPIELDNANRPFTLRFDELPLASKLVIELLFGWIWASIYRIAKFTETLRPYTLVAGVLCFGLFVFMWPIDFVSVLVYGKLTFLAD